MRKKLLLLTLLVGAGSLIPVSAEQFDCIADTWIRESAASAKNGTAEQIELGMDGTTTRAGLFSFNFSLPAGKRVEKATFHFISKLARSEQNLKTIVYPYSNDFDEANANWDSEKTYYQEAVENGGVAQFDMAGQNGKAFYDTGLNDAYQNFDAWVNDVDITEYVISKSNSTRINIMLTYLKESQTPQPRIYSKENKGESSFKYDGGPFTADQLKPYLEVVFVDASADDPEIVLTNSNGGYSQMKVTWPTASTISLTNNGNITAGSYNLTPADGVVATEGNSLIINLLTLPRGQQFEITIPAGYVSVDGKNNKVVTRTANTPAKSTFSGTLADGKVAPVADTFIRTGNTTNQANADKLEIRKDGDTYFAGLLGFPLSIAADKQVKKATLHLVTERKKNGAGDIKIYPYSNNFEENTIWANEADYVTASLAGNTVATLTLQSQNDRAIGDGNVNADNQDLSKWTNDIDVTEYVKGVSGNRVNFMLINEESPQICFFTKENKGVVKDDGLILKWASEITADDLVPYLYVELEDKVVTKNPGTVAVASDNKSLTYSFAAGTTVTINNVAGEITAATDSKSYELKVEDGVVSAKDHVLTVDLRTLPAGKTYKVSIPEGYLTMGEDVISAAVVDHEVATPAKTAHSGSLGENVYTPIHDTFVRETAAENNYGKDNKFEINSGSTFVALLSFDVPVPEGKQINSAKLRLVSERGKDSSNEVSIYPYSHDFNESTATWTTESQYVSEALSKTPIESFIAKGHGQRAIYESSLPESHHALENWVNEVDVTSYASTHEGGRINFLLSKEGANQVCFFSKDNTGIDNGDNLSLFWTVDITASDLVPTLTVTYGAEGSTAIESLDTDNDAPVEYYDLNGRRVANPDKGIYIMRQGGKAVKVIR